jgi:2-polyprenyl-3-methyl-5-hydroxy-6-metoxy-1,4-benzoquinol methylase
MSPCRPILSELIPNKESRILMLGCGNSTLSTDMFQAGYTNITNLDYSDVLITKMRNRFPSMQWKVMDVRELKEKCDELGGKETWDVVLDKGTMDALMAEKGSVWDPSDTVRENVRREVDGALE